MLDRIAALCVLISIFSLAAAPAANADSGALPLPAPGTYKLDRIQSVPLSLVREGDGDFVHLLSRYTTGKITLLTFFYSYCRDPNGCPLAWAAFEEVRSQVEADPKLHGKVRLVFISFDPTHDAPETLRLFNDTYNDGRNATPWRFLTAWNDWALRRMLSRLGQEIFVEQSGADGKDVVIDHILKVFLIDRDGWVREIYTSSFLGVDAIMGDIRTLEIEDANGRRK